MIGSLYYDNKDLVDKSYDGIVYAANHVALNMGGDTGQSVELQTDNELGNMFMIQYDPAIKGHKRFISDGYLGTELSDNTPVDASDADATVVINSTDIDVTIDALIGSQEIYTIKAMFETGKKYRLELPIGDMSFPFSWNVRVSNTSALPFTTTEPGTWEWTSTLTGEFPVHIYIDDNAGGEQIGDTITLGYLSVKEILAEEKYYINAVEQGTLPARPDKDTIIVLGNTAVLGNPDVITERKGNFQLSSVMWTEQEIIDKHNDFIRANYTVVLHDGEEVTHNGVLVYTT